METDGGIRIRPLLEAIRDQYLLEWDGLHGIAHWGRVLENGLLVADTTGVRHDLVVLFAVFHDACRRNDGLDPQHGRRGAELAASLRGDLFQLGDAEFDLLFQACVHHTDGQVQGDPVLQTCWDADRLDLARAGIIPSPRQLCTPAARNPEVIRWATRRSLGNHLPELVVTAWGQDLGRPAGLDAGPYPGEGAG